MFQIKREDFDKLVARHYPDYVGHCLMDHTWEGRTCHKGDWCGIDCIITGQNPGRAILIFEHIHFEIV